MSRALFLDIYCRPCEEAGQDYRRARFYKAEDGQVGSEPYSLNQGTLAPAVRTLSPAEPALPP